ncbi:MAG: anthranilate synthase component I [Dehalococcoidia bacterium]
MYYPSLKEVKSLARQGNLVPVYREVTADLETPVTAYLKVARGPYSFLLESVEGGERIARYSFIGAEPRQVIRTGLASPARTYVGDGVEMADHGSVDPLKPVEEALVPYRPVSVEGLPRFHGGAVGYLAYEAVRYFERLPQPAPDPLALPESVFMISDTLVVFDHVQHTMKVVGNVYLDGDVEAAYADAVARIDRIIDRLERPLGRPLSGTPAETPPGAFQSNMTQAQFEAMVECVKRYIVAGDIIQAVVSQRLRRETDAHPFDIYRALRKVNPSPYMFYLDLDGFQIVGASPEMLVQVERGRVATNPIAGTRPRGADEAEDLALERELRADEKERAEHVMLVDLGRNDIGRVSEAGTVQVDQFLDVERFSHVMHLVSRVNGTLRAGMTSFDALRACFPVGTVSGAPKIRAMEIIAELEPHQRGPYAGGVGYFDFSGDMDTCIALRTMVVKDGVAYVQAGGGIVYDSVPEREYQETLHKAAASLRALDEAEAMEQRVGPLQQRGETAGKG